MLGAYWMIKKMNQPANQENKQIKSKKYQRLFISSLNSAREDEKK